MIAGKGRASASQATAVKAKPQPLKPASEPSPINSRWLGLAMRLSPAALAATQDNHFERTPRSFVPTAAASQSPFPDGSLWPHLALRSALPSLANRPGNILDQPASVADTSAATALTRLQPWLRAVEPSPVSSLWQTLALRSPHALPSREHYSRLERDAKSFAARAALTEPAPTLSGHDGAAGAPLPPAIRGKYEELLDADLSGVRLHTGDAAARAARNQDARAFTIGEHIAFGAGQYKPGDADSGRLLAHELAHVAQQQHGAVQPGVVQHDRQPRSRQPFERILTLHDQLVQTLERLINDLGALNFASNHMVQRLLAARSELNEVRARRDGLNRLIDLYMAGQPTEDPGFPFDPLNYIFDNRPNTREIARLERLIQNQVLLADLVRPRILSLAQQADQLGPDTPGFVRETFHRIGSYYLNLALVHWENTVALRQMAFLDTFYQDPRLIEGYALWSFMREQIPILYQRLRQSAQGGVYDPVLPEGVAQLTPFAESSIRPYRRDRGLQGRRMAAIMDSANDFLQLQAAADQVGEPPESLEEVRLLPSTETNRNLSNVLLSVQVRSSILALWRWVEPLRSMIMMHNAIGEHLYRFGEQDRERWLNDLVALEDEFNRELGSAAHPDINEKILAWGHRLEVMATDIPPEARRTLIISAITEQLPFMFVAGATVARVGMWVRGLTSARWLIALAEGATMTAFSLATTRPGAPGTPTTALGWAGHFALNVAFAWIGGRLSSVTGGLAERLAGTRLAFLGIGARFAIPPVAIASLQTAAQVIEARARNQGGETDITELFTINLVLQGMGLAFGIATTPPETAAAPAGSTTALARPTVPSAAELATRFGVSEATARLMLEVAARMEDFAAHLAEMNNLARRRQLTPAQFEALKTQALEMADFLEGRLVSISRAGAMGETTPDQVQAGMARLRARLQAMVYTPGEPVRALLPQNVEGLQPAGDGTTWTYDHAHPPARLPQLRASYVGRGYTARALPSGGVEITEPQGTPVLQLLPVSPAAQAALRSLPDIARGRVTEAGLARVRAQTGIPVNLLETQLMQAAASGERPVQTILQHLGRFIEPGDQQAWRGLSNYLSLGGDTAVLARSLAYGRPLEFFAESQDLARRLLHQMAVWDQSAVDGLAALFRLRPRLTADRLHNLVGGFEPEQVTGILHSLALLEPRSRNLGQVIGPLTSGAVLSERGAMGALTSGVELAERFPDDTVAFEQPVIGATGEITRVIDVRVLRLETTRVAGVTHTREVEIGAFEVKEVSTSSLGRRAQQELSRDLVRDSQDRSVRLTPVGASRPFFETFRWRIRGLEFRQRAMQSLGTQDAADARIEPLMRTMVENQLRGALDRPEMNALSDDERQGYRNAFTGVPFVEFF